MSKSTAYTFEKEMIYAKFLPLIHNRPWGDPTAEKAREELHEALERLDTAYGVKH